MASLCAFFRIMVLLPFLAFAAFIGITTDASHVKGFFQCTRDPIRTCSHDDIPMVPHGSFNCPGGTTVGNTCCLTCDVGFCPASDNRTTCEHAGNWSNGSFQCQECRTDDQWNGSMYRFFLVEMTFSNAVKNCQTSCSGDLVVIESQEENDFVHELVLKYAPDKGQFEGWTWIGNNKSSTEYTNWAPGQPNSVPQPKAICREEECVAVIYDTGKWHDQCCNRTFYSVCKQIYEE